MNNKKLDIFYGIESHANRILHRNMSSVKFTNLFTYLQYSSCGLQLQDRVEQIQIQNKKLQNFTIINKYKIKT